jgi:hypothetical protein
MSVHASTLLASLSFAIFLSSEAFFDYGKIMKVAHLALGSSNFRNF